MQISEKIRALGERAEHDMADIFRDIDCSKRLAWSVLLSGKITGN